MISLIVGASGGIGTTVCRKLLARNRSLVVAGKDQNKLEELRNTLISEYPGAEVLTRTVDAREEAQVAALFASVPAGGLTEVVSLPGSIVLKPVHLTGLQEFRDTMEQNAVTSFLILREAVRSFLKGVGGQGSVVLVSSVAANTGLANHEAIAAAKGAVEGLARSAAATYAARGIRVNVVAPGLVQTPLSSRLTSNPNTLKASTELHPMKRIGQPDDVASAIDWLLDSSRSGWVTGQTLGVDGGMSALR